MKRRNFFTAIIAALLAWCKPAKGSQLPSFNEQLNAVCVERIHSISYVDADGVQQELAVGMAVIHRRTGRLMTLGCLWAPGLAKTYWFDDQDHCRDWIFPVRELAAKR